MMFFMTIICGTVLYVLILGAAELGLRARRHDERREWERMHPDLNWEEWHSR